MRFLFTCGGTAGHVNPALAVAGRIKELLPESEFLFIGAEDRMETDLVPRAGYEIKTVRITNLARGIKPADIKHNVQTAVNVLRSVSQAKKIISDFAPDVAVGTGGYVCFPVLYSASRLGIPTLVHESNAVPGLTTKVLERVVDRVMVGFEESRENYKHPERVVVTGTPVRGEFLRPDKLAARKKLGISEERPLVASIWGSLGAAHMNSVMVDFIGRQLAQPGFDLIHSTGKNGYSRMKSALDEKCPEWDLRGIDVREYIYDMPDVMAAADLVLCRAGASTLAELCALGKPAILVPSPNVTNNHQEKNARVLENAGGARVMLEADCDADSLFHLISGLLRDPETIESMGRSMAALGVTDATERIAELVLDLARGAKK